jgi:hypothetical protein
MPASRGIGAAKRISTLFEEATTQRRISLDDMFDNEYIPIPCTDQIQHRMRFLSLVEEILPNIQEPFLANDKRMVFCVAIDRNCYLPVHNEIYSLPQRPGETIWNTANCRNRRIFDDRAGLSAGRVVRPYLIQNYPRQMGDRIDMMWEIGAPIRVFGKQWGGFRTAYNYDAIRSQALTSVTSTSPDKVDTTMCLANSPARAAAAIPSDLFHQLVDRRRDNPRQKSPAFPARPHLM